MRINVQWKGTDVCLDFECTCDPSKLQHFDGFTFGRFKCWYCGKVWQLGQPKVTAASPGFTDDVPTLDPDDEVAL